MAKVTELHFTIHGEYLTEVARQALYHSGNLNRALDILTNSMVSDELSKREVYNMALAILNGEAELRGTYPGDDYGFYYLEEKDKNYDLSDFIMHKNEEIKRLKEEYDELLEKFSFVTDSLSEWEAKCLNSDFKDATGKRLFNNIGFETEMDSMLKSFLDRQKTNMEDDYGWLEPNGTFHPVEWGLHNDWADDYLKEKYPDEKEYNAIHRFENDDGTHEWYISGDILVHKFNWVLLHNPAQGIAFPTRNHTKNYTKAQREFLYDYYVKRGQNAQANELIKEEEMYG